jgi:hypothetical protein
MKPSFLCILSPLDQDIFSRNGLLLNVSWWSCEDEKSIVLEGKILESSIDQGFWKVS